jgi:hypothetical protein
MIQVEIALPKQSNIPIIYLHFHFGTLLAYLLTDLHINKYDNMKMYKSLLDRK